MTIKNMTNNWNDYFEDGEKLLWEGRPDTRIFLMSLGDKYRLLLAGIWVVFMLYFAKTMFDSGALVFVNLLRSWPLLVLTGFILAILYFTIGRWLVDAYSRRHTVYAISNRRAFIAKSAFGKKLTDMRIKPGMEILLSKGELGAITFQKQTSLFKNWNKWGVDDGSFTFRGLQEPEKAYAMVEKIQTRLMKGL